jgi:glucokinase-like ROK family protein
MRYKKPSPQDLRKKNRSAILREIYFNENVSRLEVSNQLGISPATATNVVTELVEKEILVESGLRKSESGRPSTLLKVNPEYANIIGIEVGETYIRAELFDLKFNQLAALEVPLKAIVTSETVVSKLQHIVEEISTASQVTHQELLGIGIGFPGLVDAEKGVSVFTPNWGWRNVSIRSQLSEKINVPIFMENGAKAMAVGELLFGGGRNVSNFVVLLIGTGVGAGIIVDGKLFRGSGNNAGEFGHTIIDIDGPSCRCGSRGCVEAYIGSNGILSRFHKSMELQAEIPLHEQMLEVNNIVNQALEGDAFAKKIVDETVQYLGVCVANIVNLVNPGLVLIGGWSGLLLGTHYLPEIEKVVQNYALKESFEKTRISLCELGHDSVAKGAAGVVLEHFFEGDIAL